MAFFSAPLLLSYVNVWWIQALAAMVPLVMTALTVPDSFVVQTSHLTLSVPLLFVSYMRQA